MWGCRSRPRTLPWWAKDGQDSNPEPPGRPQAAWLTPSSPLTTLIPHPPSQPKPAGLWEEPGAPGLSVASPGPALSPSGWSSGVRRAGPWPIRTLTGPAGSDPHWAPVSVPRPPPRRPLMRILLWTLEWPAPCPPRREGRGAKPGPQQPGRSGGRGGEGQGLSPSASQPPPPCARAHGPPGGFGTNTPVTARREGGWRPGNGPALSFPGPGNAAADR